MLDYKHYGYRHRDHVIDGFLTGVSLLVFIGVMVLYGMGIGLQ